MFIKTLTISEVNNYIKKTMDNDFILRNVSIKGEISNFKIHSSGHIYFSLKDNAGKINCIMFRDNAKNLSLIPNDGDNVIAKGRISVYEKEGVYQLYCEKLELEGQGQLFIAFEKLKKKLNEKGLFDEVYKKTIPQYPKKIGVITSPTGAAIRDIINVITRRNKFVNLLIYPSLVQGEKASENIIKGIKDFNTRKDIDIIIIARGGGSIEELWAFNNEDLALEIFNSKIPIITGIGHQTDFTIADFVSDKRASTPSAAAEIAVIKEDDIKEKLRFLKNIMDKEINKNINNKKNEINIIKRELELNNPIHLIANQYLSIDKYKTIMEQQIINKIYSEKQKVQNLKSLLEAHNPSNILKKGYNIIEDGEGNILSNVSVLKHKKTVIIKMKDGKGKFNIKFMEDL